MVIYVVMCNQMTGAQQTRGALRERLLLIISALINQVRDSRAREINRKVRKTDLLRMQID